jgi:hypothetical protein
MAEVIRVNGDSQPVLNSGVQTVANNVIIATGIPGPVTVYNIECGGNLSGELGAPNAEGKTAAVETLLKTVAANASIVAYNVNASTGVAGHKGASLTVLVERSGWTSNAALQTAVRALGANVGARSTVKVDDAFVVETSLQYIRP